MKGILFSIGCILCLGLSAQQVVLEGRVVDYYNRKPVEAVNVFSSSGKYAITDSLGKFLMQVPLSDSIWFSFLGKKTMKYLVDTISDRQHFEIALMIDARYLPEVKVRSSNYTLDSLQNRKDYAKVFNFRKPGLAVTSNPTYVPGAVSAGLDINELINMFRFKRNRRILSLQQRLLLQEQDKYINHRFSKRFVRQLTPLTGTALDSFLQIYRPSYEFLQQLNDLELGVYIQQSYEHYRLLKQTGTLRREGM